MTGTWGLGPRAWAKAVTAIVLLSASLASAQSLSYSRGQNVSPAYEGWEVGADGVTYFVFGYMNRNWEEEVDVAAGPANGLSIGGADQGQPTRFLPRRNRFVFRVPVPKGFTEKDELVWTLTTQGKTEKAYASLRLDYQIDDVVRASETGALGAGTSSPEIRANKPPTVEVQGRKALDAKVGQPVTLIVEVGDDGIPKRRSSGLSGAAVANTGSRRDVGADTPPDSQAPIRVNRATLPPEPARPLPHLLLQPRVPPRIHQHRRRRSATRPCCRRPASPWARTSACMCRGSSIAGRAR